MLTSFLAMVSSYSTILASAVATRNIIKKNIKKDSYSHSNTYIVKLSYFSLPKVLAHLKPTSENASQGYRKILEADPCSDGLLTTRLV